MSHCPCCNKFLSERQILTHEKFGPGLFAQIGAFARGEQEALYPKKWKAGRVIRSDDARSRGRVKEGSGVDLAFSDMGTDTTRVAEV